MAVPVYVMKTDHGTHHHDTWATMLGDVMFPVAADASDPMSARTAQFSIVKALSGHAKTILDRERQLLAKNANARFDAAHDGQEFVDAAVADIFEILKDTKWGEQFREREALLRHELEMYFGSMQSVERLHHNDQNPCAKGHAYRARTHGTGEIN